jgi:hypothetical protein
VAGAMQEPPEDARHDRAAEVPVKFRVQCHRQIIPRPRAAGSMEQFGLQNRVTISGTALSDSNGEMARLFTGDRR